MSTHWILAILALVIISLLAGYAGKLLWQLRLQRQARLARQQQAAKQQRQLQIDKNTRLWHSIDTICRATQQGQCCTSEAAIRLCVLLENLAFDGAQPELAKDFPGIHGLYSAIKHHPTHDARKDYSKKEIRQFDKEREQYERDYDQQVQQDLNQLLQQQLPLIA